MKLSAAIRAGIGQTKQAREVYQDAAGGLCALGAAMVGMGLRPTQIHDLRRLCADMYERVTCPHCHCVVPLQDAVTCLNDNAEWSRSRIADWLEAQKL